METLIIVLVVLMAGAAVLTGVALYRGWFCLASVPTESKGQFVLTRKKETVAEIAKVAPLNAEISVLKAAAPPTQNEESR